MTSHNPPLLPEQTRQPDDWQKTFNAIIEAGTAKSTRRAYKRDLTYIEGWNELTFGTALTLPVSEAVVIRFVLDHVDTMNMDVETALITTGLKRQPGPLKISTLRRYLSTLSVIHQTAGFESPTHSPRVKLLLRRVRNARQEQPKKKAAITKSILNDLISTCSDDLRGIHDAALLCVGFATGGRRRSELASLQIEDLEKIDNGYLLHLRRSKTDQGGNGRVLPVLGMAAWRLNRWLLKSGLRQGNLFRGISKSDTLTRSITGRTINSIIKRRAELAGLDPTCFGAHSLRAGFLTEAARRGTPLGDAMELSGHRSQEIAGGYYRAATLTENPAARLLDTVEQSSEQEPLLTADEMMFRY